MRIKSYIDRGDSFPVILDDNGEHYFVKLRAGMNGKYALVNEWFGNTLGRNLGIKTQIPRWFELQNSIIIDDIHIEVKDLIAKSYGINIGFVYRVKAKEVKKNELGILNNKEAIEIFLFDLIMINIDRTNRNTNLMQVGNDIISVDYEASLLFQDLLTNKTLLNDSRILYCLRNNPLYQEINDEVICDFIEKLNEISVVEILDDISFDLLNNEERFSFIKGVEERKKNNWYLEDVLKKLKEIKTETKEELKLRIRKNRDNFKRNFNERSIS